MSEGGYVKIYRRLKDWEWYSDANTARVYLHILLSANHRTVRFKGAISTFTALSALFSSS